MSLSVPTIDLNADLGEGAGHDEELLDVVTSANVACGAHAGDAETIRRTCLAAAERGVVVGAHPGYPDRPGFGRVALNLPEQRLAGSLAEQLAELAAGARHAGLTPAYLKAHGALYHRAAADPATTVLLQQAASAAGLLVLLGPPGLSTPMPGPLRHVVEGFADRAYTVDGAGRAALLDRREPGALLPHDAAVTQAVALATTGLAAARDGSLVAVHPRSICVHGDSPGAVALAREIRSELERAGVLVKAFT